MSEKDNKKRKPTKRRRRKGEAAFILAVVGGSSVKAAAKAAGIGITEAYRRSADPAFKRRVSRMQAKLITRSLAMMKTNLVAAAKRLGVVVRSADEAVSLPAAWCIFEHAAKLLSTVELAEEVAKLKQLFGKPASQWPTAAAAAQPTNRPTPAANGLTSVCRRRWA
jgi:hypothetical protein